MSKIRSLLIVICLGSLGLLGCGGDEIPQKVPEYSGSANPTCSIDVYFLDVYLLNETSPTKTGKALLVITKDPAAGYFDYIIPNPSPQVLSDPCADYNAIASGDFIVQYDCGFSDPLDKRSLDFFGRRLINNTKFWVVLFNGSKYYAYSGVVLDPTIFKSRSNLTININNTVFNLGRCYEWVP